MRKHSVEVLLYRGGERYASNSYTRFPDDVPYGTFTAKLYPEGGAPSSLYAYAEWTYIPSPLTNLAIVAAQVVVDGQRSMVAPGSYLVEVCDVPTGWIRAELWEGTRPIIWSLAFRALVIPEEERA